MFLGTASKPKAAISISWKFIIFIVFPLAAYVKRLGKQSVVTAGATQLLFGIKGARWDKAETPVPYNDNWIRPRESEKPSGAQSVESGCYW